MKSPGPIALRAAQDAQLPDNLSVREEGTNRGKWIDVYNKTAGAEIGSPWCASLQFTRLKLAAGELGLVIPASFDPRAYTPTWRAWAIRNQCWIPVADAQGAVRVGDMALFHFASMGRIGHIEVVVAVHDWGVETVGGNTGPDAGDSVDREGQGVFRKKRKWSQLGSRGGFARLPF